jgi:hypothetical protein
MILRVEEQVPSFFYMPKERSIEKASADDDTAHREEKKSALGTLPAK